MEVNETQLPGVGTRYTVRFDDGGEFTVLVRNEGTRDVYWQPDPDDDDRKLFSATERQARELAEIFDGTYFEPVDDDLEEVWEEALVEWVELPAGSPAVGDTLGNLGVRSTTGVTVIAVQRGGDTVSNPDSGFRFEAGDVLVAVGSGEGHAALEELLDAGDPS